MDDKSLNLEPIAIVPLWGQFGWSLAAVFGGPFLLTLSLALLSIFKEGVGWGIWIPPIPMGGICAIALFVWWRKELILTEDAICSRTTFLTKIIPLRDVIEMGIPPSDNYFKLGLPGQLVVRTQDRHGQKNVIIHLGLFDPVGFGNWLDASQEQLAKCAKGLS